MTERAAGPAPPVALIGMMGCGKSVVGRRLAALLGVAFVDTDEHLARAAGGTVADIFAREGEAGFRARERQLIARLADWPGAVLALGGGMFVGDENVAAIRERCFTVWLRARVATLLARVGEDRGAVRPLLADADPAARLSALLRDREPWYRRAHAIIDVDELAVEAAARAVRAAIPGSPGCG